MQVRNFFGSLGLSAITLLGSSVITAAQSTTNQPTQEVILTTPPRPTPPEQRPAPSPTTPSPQACTATVSQPGVRSERVELYYYRNADQMVNALNQVFPMGQRCASTLPLNAPQAGSGVGRGGGNVIFLRGNSEYIDNAKRFMTALDLPLSGINLRMWGVQISSRKPKKLAETLVTVRQRISTTQQLLRDTLSRVQGVSLTALNNSGVDSKFKIILQELGYAAALDGREGESLLEVFLIISYKLSILHFPSS